VFFDECHQIWGTKNVTFFNISIFSVRKVNLVNAKLVVFKSVGKNKKMNNGNILKNGFYFFEYHLKLITGNT